MKQYREFQKTIFFFLFVSVLAGCGGGRGRDGNVTPTNGGTATIDIGKVEPLNPAKVATDPQTGQQVVNDQILITFKDTVSENAAAAKIASINGEIVGYIKGMNDYQVRIKGNPTIGQLKTLVTQLNSDPDVEAAMLNAVVISDQSLKLEKPPDAGKDPKWFEGFFNRDSWDESDPGGRNWGLEAIYAPSAWDSNDKMSSVKIGIMDVGFELDHEDLHIPASNAQNTSSGGAMEVDDHGTHIAGIIGGESNNNNGVTGIVWKKELFLFKRGTQHDIELLKRSQIFEYKYGIVWLLEKGSTVLNFSLGVNFRKGKFGLPSDSNLEHVKTYIEEPRRYWTAFIQRLINKNYNFLMIQSAGNDGVDAKWNGFLSSIDDHEVKKRIIIVGAIERSGIWDRVMNILSGRSWSTNPYVFVDEWDDSKPYGSNYGDKVDIVAPGKNIYSAVKNNGYALMSGTSMAAPHVTGVAAMVWAINPNLTAEQVKNIVVDTADRPVTYEKGDKIRRYKILNAKAAVERSKSDQATGRIQQPATGILIGKVVDAITSHAIDGAKVSVFKGTNYEIYTASTISTVDGSYELILETGTYRVSVGKGGYFFENVYVTVTEGITTYIATLRSVPSTSSGDGLVSGYITNAFIAEQGIGGLSITFRQGIDAMVGDISETTSTGSNGFYSITLPAGNYTGEITGSGYSTGYFLVVSVGDTTTSNQNGSVTPIIPEGQTRIILTWGSTPYDLDSHLTGPMPESNSRFHVYFDARGSSTLSPYANLDVDDISSYGPETITVYQQFEGIYRYSVRDFSHGLSSSSTALSNSGARAKVYKGNNLVATFDVPSNQEGTLWTVFELSGNTITPINTMSYVSNSRSIQKGSFLTTQSDAELFKSLPQK